MTKTHTPHTHVKYIKLNFNILPIYIEYIHNIHQRSHWDRKKNFFKYNLVQDITESIKIKYFLI